MNRMSGQVLSTDDSFPSPFSHPEQVSRLHDIKSICCVGAGYVGGPTSAVIALKNPHISVAVVDKNRDLINAWNSDCIPIYEPGLSTIIKATRVASSISDSEDDESKDESYRWWEKPLANPDAEVGPTAQNNRDAIRNLRFSTDIDQAIFDADIILISVDTPTKIEGKGKNFAADISSVESVTRQIANVSNGYKIIVEKSTVPCKTAESIREILLANSKPGATFDILSNPEFLSEGTAIENLLHPDRVLIGSMKTPSGRKAASTLSSVYESWISSDHIITTNIWSSELAKLAANAILAQRISSVNALSAICEEIGADIEEVTKVCGMDSRIGSQMLKASVGFGGSCFRKDILSLVYLAESLSLYSVAKYWKAVVSLNEEQKQRFSTRVIACLFNTIKRKKIAVLGFAYKKDTGDARESPAITLVRDFVAEDAYVSIFDPKVPFATMKKELLGAGISTVKLKTNVSAEQSPYHACAQADAVIVATEWEMFSNKDNAIASSQGGIQTGNGSKVFFPKAQAVTNGSQNIKKFDVDDLNNRPIPASTRAENMVDNMKPLDWSRIAEGMRKPRFVFDGRNILDMAKLRALGFSVEAIGKSALCDN